MIPYIKKVTNIMIARYHYFLQIFRQGTEISAFGSKFSA